MVDAEPAVAPQVHGHDSEGVSRQDLGAEPCAVDSHEHAALCFLAGGELDVATGRLGHRLDDIDATHDGAHGRGEVPGSPEGLAGHAVGCGDHVLVVELHLIDEEHDAAVW